MEWSIAAFTTEQVVVLVTLNNSSLGQTKLQLLDRLAALIRPAERLKKFAQASCVSLRECSCGYVVSAPRPRLYRTTRYLVERAMKSAGRAEFLCGVSPDWTKIRS